MCSLTVFFLATSRVWCEWCSGYDVSQLLLTACSALMGFLESGDDCSWTGYLYAVGLFLATVSFVCCYHQLLHGTFNVGMRIRTTLTTAIYRKVRCSDIIS